MIGSLHRREYHVEIHLQRFGSPFDEAYIKGIDHRLERGGE